MIKLFIDKFLRALYPLFQRNYTKTINGSKHRLFVSYLSAPMYHINDRKYLNHHQNRRETIIMSSVLDELSLSHKIVRLDKPLLNYGGYDIIFGVEPNFIKACKANPKAIKIYYATGAYNEHQNKVIRERTDEFNRFHGTNVPYYRLVSNHNSAHIADRIIQIGSKYTVETYPEELRCKIVIIRQSGHTYNLPGFLQEKLESYSRKDFIWMGSSGSILKGLDLVLDYFLDHKELNLHVFGNIDTEVMDYYSPLLKDKSNIHLYGMCDLDSQFVLDVAKKSSFVILPSASEGCLGSVLNMAKLGCIPIVSRYAAFDGIEDYGDIMSNLTIEALHNSISKVMDLEESTLRERIINIYHFANEYFTPESFRNDFKQSLQLIINEEA